MKKGLIVGIGGYTAILISTIQTILITRKLGPVDVGSYSVFRQFSLLGAQLVTLGIPTSMVYFISVQKKTVKELLSTNIIVHAFLSVILLLALWIWKGEVIEVLKCNPAISVIIPFGYTFLVGIRYYFYNALIANLAVKKTALIDTIPVISSFTLLLTLFFLNKLSLTTLLFFDLIITPLTAALIGYIFIRKQEGSVVGNGVNLQLFWMQSKYGFWMNLSDFILLLLFYLVYRVVGIYSNNDEAVGYYSRAFSIINIFVTSLMFIVRYFYASWSKLEIDEKKGALIRAVMFSFFVSMPAAILISLAATPIVILLFGSKFLISALYLKVLIFSIPFNIVNLLLASFNNSEGRVKQNAILMAFSVVVFCILSYSMPGEKKLINVAYFYLVAVFTVTVLMLVTISRKHKINGSYYLSQFKSIRRYFRFIKE